MNYNSSDLSRADDARFATMLSALLTKALAKRKITAEDLAMGNTLLQRFTQKQAGQRIAVVAGATDRKQLIALLRRNTNLIKEMRTQLSAYQNSPTKHEVWLRFQGYTKLIILGGGGPKGGPAAKPAA